MINIISKDVLNSRPDISKDIISKVNKVKIFIKKHGKTK